MQTERLQKLADHLRGPLAASRFDFTRLWRVTDCGTAGCALGELPDIWPEDWHLVELPNNFGSLLNEFEPRLIETKCQGAWEAFQDAEVFFGISDDEATFLFQPAGSRAVWDREHEQDKYELTWSIAPWNTLPLFDDSTPAQVADSIERFITWKAAQ